MIPPQVFIREANEPKPVWSLPPTVQIVLSLLSAVVAGYVTAEMEMHTVCELASLAALLILFCATLKAIKNWCVVELAFASYSIALVVLDAFAFAGNQLLLAFAGNQLFVVTAILLLVPVMCGLVVCLDRKAWLCALGTWLVLFSGTSVLTFNVYHASRSWAFFSQWVA